MVIFNVFIIVSLVVCVIVGIAIVVTNPPNEPGDW